MPALASSLPQLEWVEREQDWQLHVELPGLSKENVQMHLDPEIHLLTLRAESSEGSNSEAGNGKGASDAEGAGPTAMTMRRRSFSASVRLPEDVDMQAVDTLQASMKDGLLTLSLPKVKQAPPKQPKQIPVM
ncbi:HSP20-like chaperone [Haematococcus lacustris]